MNDAQKRKKYSTILADPPWDVQQKGHFGAARHYDLMTLEEIKSMPVSDLATENAHCYLWCTAATLEHSYDVLRRWGFEPKSIFVWLKMGRLGLGQYFRNCCEFCLMGVKGKLPVQFRAQPNWAHYPLQDHSHKPEEFYEVIERMSPGPYLELFARRPRHGWDHWGNEIESDVVIPGYPVPQYSFELDGDETTREIMAKVRKGAKADAS